jgi:hypothetical protein
VGDPAGLIDRPCDVVPSIAVSSPPISLRLAIPNFPTALLKTPRRRTYSSPPFDSDIGAGGAREEALSCPPGSLLQLSTRVYLEPAAVEHPDTPRTPDAVDITLLCSRLAVTLHLLRLPLAYHSRAASADTVCWLTTRVSRLVSVYPRHTTQLPSVPEPPSSQSLSLGSLAAVGKLTIP